MPYKVLIVGGGIGGLTTALCLQQHGHETLVLEKSQQLSDMGAGLQCAANTVQVMESLGLRESLESLAVQALRADFRHFQSGKTLYKTEFGEAYRSRYGAPYLHVHRADLLGLLRSTFEQRSPGKLLLDAEVQNYQETDEGVRVILQDERVFEADLLVFADGIHSDLRQQPDDTAAPIFTGNVAWRGIVDAVKLPDDFMPRIVSNFVGPKKHMVIYYLRKQQLVNFVGVVENSTWQEASWVAHAPWEELRSDFCGWHSTVDAIINTVDKQECYRWALHQQAPYSNWSTARTSLLGDAAHATLPFMAAGAAMAIEDARVLQRSLTQESNLSDALQLYQRNRLPRTAKVQKLSARAGKLYHLESAWAQRMAFLGLRFVGNPQLEFLSEYDANTVPLL